jgi:hypothetical protein
MKANLSQNKVAFTLIEVLMVLGLLTMCLGVVVRLQMRSFDRIEQDQHLLQKTYLIKRAMLDALRVPRIEKLQLIKKEYEDGAIKARTALHDVAKKSKIKKISNQVRALVTDIAWQERPGYKQRAELVYFMYLPEEKKQA